MEALEPADPALMAELLLLQELLADGADPEPRTVVLVGVTGDGKSSTGNTLCGRPAFATSDGLSSATAEPVPADYALSGERIDEIIDRVMNMKGYAATLEEMPEDTLHARPESMETVLSLVGERWGTMGDYLRSGGLEDEDVARLRAKCLE